MDPQLAPEKYADVLSRIQNPLVTEMLLRRRHEKQLGAPPASKQLAPGPNDSLFSLGYHDQSALTFQGNEGVSASRESTPALLAPLLSPDARRPLPEDDYLEVLSHFLTKSTLETNSQNLRSLEQYRNELAFLPPSAGSSFTTAPHTDKQSFASPQAQKIEARQKEPLHAEDQNAHKIPAGVKKQRSSSRRDAFKGNSQRISLRFLEEKLRIHQRLRQARAS